VLISRSILFLTVCLLAAAVYGLAAEPPAASAKQPSVGEGSCTGERACEGLTGRVGDNSCIGVQACTNNAGDIGDNSCNGENCAENSGQIGDNSCNMYSGNCTANQGSIGNGSCGAGVVDTCTENSGEIGDKSCGSLFACPRNQGRIGDFSMFRASWPLHRKQRPHRRLFLQRHGLLRSKHRQRRK